MRRLRRDGARAAEALPRGALSLCVAFLALFGPIAALLGLALDAIVAIVMCIWQLVGIPLPSAPRARALCAASLSAGLFGFVIVNLSRKLDPIAGGQETREVPPVSACAIVGYSTVRGDALRWNTPGAWSVLEESCARCKGATARQAKEAQTLRWIRETTCAPSFPLEPGGAVVFFGGANDDFFWGTNTAGKAAGLLTLLRYSFQPPGPGVWAGFLERTAEGSLDMIEAQTAEIRTIGTCAAERRRELLFVHDFLIFDLDGGRSPARAEMFRRRRAAAEEAGAEFVDFLDEVRAEAGVAFMNDFVHPSAVGHRRIGEIVCEHLSNRRR